MSRLAFAVSVLLFCSSFALAGEGGSQVFRRKVMAKDGTALALYRFSPPGGGLSKPAVLLVPDVGMGRQAYDLSGKGLARFLAERGFDTYVLELRGAGASGAKGTFKLADQVAQDLPAALAVIESSHPGKVDLVLHGWTGALVLGATTAPPLSGRVDRVVAISVPVEPAVPNAVTAALLRGGGRLSSLGGDPDGAKAFELLFARHGDFAKGVLEALRSSAFSDLSPSAAKELLSFMERGDFTYADGSTFKARLSSYDRETLQVLPLLDNFAHAEFASPMRELCPKAKVQVKVLAQTEGMDEDYTHLSTLHGKGAADDVYAPIAAFLSVPRESKETEAVATEDAP